MQRGRGAIAGQVTRPSRGPTLRWAVMASGDRGEAGGDSHWVRWHAAYEDPNSPLSLRLRLVQELVWSTLDEIPVSGSDGSSVSGSGQSRFDRNRSLNGDLETSTKPFRIVSLCSGQGRDVIDVLATHPRAAGVTALLVDLDPDLVAFARARAEAAGLTDRVRVVQGDASQCRLYAADVPADLVLVCGVFGNISSADISTTIRALPAFCVPGASVVWTRHRRPPDLTPSIRAQFVAAGLAEVTFAAPEGFLFGTGRNRLVGDPGIFGPFEPERTLFDFVGDGMLPA